MAKRAVDRPFVQLGTEEISTYVEQCKLSLGVSAVDISALGDGYESYTAGNSRRWAVTLGLFQEYNSSEAPIYRLIKNMFTNTGNAAGSTFVVRPSTAVADRFNPQLQGTVALDGDFDFLNAVRNEANKFSITLKGNGAPTFTDTSS